MGDLVPRRGSQTDLDTAAHSTHPRTPIIIDIIGRSEEPELKEALHPSEDIYERHVCVVAVLYIRIFQRLLLLLLPLLLLSTPFRCLWRLSYTSA